MQSPSLRLALLVGSLLIYFPSSTSAAALQVARVFGDHMVLQQQQMNPVWGKSTPGALIRVTVGSATAETHAYADGNWWLQLPSLPAGGPYEMIVQGPESKVFKNVMVGEVWLVSGQSNMDFRLTGAIGAAADIASADFPGIRCVRIPQTVSRVPLQDLGETSWQVCSPATAGGFSAVAFYFARELHRQRGVTVGLINATWSGTPAEAWTSNSALAVLPAYADRLKAIATSTDDWAAGQKASERTDAERDQVFEKGTVGFKLGVHLASYHDQEWPVAEYPLSAAKMHLPDYAIVWARKTIDVPPTAAGHDLTLNLGRCYEWDQTYFNGEQIGTIRWDAVRQYTVPGRLVKAGMNTIAIRLYSEWSAGQIGKGRDIPTLATSDRKTQISLLGPWKYNSSIEPALIVPRYFQREPTSLYNGMIAPIAGYGLRGALWYQGEGNAGNPHEYQTLLPSLIQEWRWHWGQGDFPFLVVQLPSTAEYDWPELREAQAMAVRLPKVGLAVTLDIGDPENLHPANKRPFGERLFLVARHVAYGENLAWTGPVFTDAEPLAESLHVHFTECGSGLVTRDDKAIRGFEIRGATGPYVPAEASIEGSSVIVRASTVVNPVAVRYAWAPNPDANLVNREGLPAAPFRFEPVAKP